MSEINRPPLPQDLIERENAARLAALQDEYASLGRALDRRGPRSTRSRTR